MLEFKIDSDLCNRCGECAEECPRQIINQRDRELPFISSENEEKCMECQHCLAICPTAALSILGCDPKDSIELSKKQLPSQKQMDALIRGRRSIRKFKDKNVDSDLIQELLKTVANAPTGVNKRMLDFHLIDDKEILSQFRKRAFEATLVAEEEKRIPEDSALVRMAHRFVDDNVDVIFRGAPHLLLVSTSVDSACPQQDVDIALAYFELLAQSAGLGTVWCGLLKHVLEGLPEMKTLMGLPLDRPYYAMLFGHPDVHFARSVQRDDAAKIKRVVFTD
jgi:nitroreductase/NAD-dependent dihydropyrimidine dehydrogenase PreA subunit